MRASRGEIKIEEILQMNDMTFVEVYTFPDLVSFSGHPLRFDFAVFYSNRGALDSAKCRRLNAFANII